jgi:periplasmic copper chaperone A
MPRPDRFFLEGIMPSKLLALAASLLVFLFAAGALAQSGSVTLSDAWARATPGGAQTAAAYLTLQSPTGDRLTAVATPAAQKAELHTMTMDGGVMKMRQVDGIDLPPGQAVTLKPGGYHIMLTGLAEPLQEGQSVPLTLTFAKAGNREVTATVQKIGAMGPSATGAGGETGHGMNMPGMTMPMHH